MIILVEFRFQPVVSETAGFFYFRPTVFSQLGFFIFNLNSTNFDTYKIIPDHIKHHLQKSHGILKKMLAFLCEVYYNRDILNPRKQGFVWH